LSSFHEPVFGGFLLFRYLMLLLRGKKTRKKREMLAENGRIFRANWHRIAGVLFFIFFYLGNRFFVFNLNGFNWGVSIRCIVQYEHKYLMGFLKNWFWMSCYWRKSMGNVVRWLSNWSE
jgi:hypothetical protein